MQRAQHIDQHDLPVDPGEMRAEERLDHLGLVGLIPAVHFLPEATARGGRGLRQRRKGQDRASRKLARQQEPPRRAIRPARRPRILQIGGEPGRQRLRAAFLKRVRGILGPGDGQKFATLGPFGHADQRIFGPVGIGLVQKRKVQQPFAGVIDDVEMHGLRPFHPGQKPRGLDPEGQAEFRHRAGAFRPMRVIPGERGQMALEIKAGDGVIGLGLQIGGLNPARGLGAQLRHPPPIQQIGDQSGDEHCLARPRQTRHAKAHHAVGERVGDGGHQPLKAAAQLIGQITDGHTHLPAKPASFQNIGIEGGRRKGARKKGQMRAHPPLHGLDHRPDQPASR